jgi:hypothetical protein
MSSYRSLVVALATVFCANSTITAREVELRSSQFVYRLDTTDGLRGESWHNRLTGKTVSLGKGPEVELDFDAAEQWITIPGWRTAVSQSQPSAPDDDQGFRAGWFRPEFNDLAWRIIGQPACDGVDDENAHVWMREKIALPADAKNKPLTLTLGGFSIFDYRYMRVFLNGHEIGVRSAPGRWREPLVIELGPGSKSHDRVVYGGENVLALQMSGCVTRLPRLEELNPSRSRSQAMRQIWPGQFEQYLKIGPPVVTPKLEVVSKNIKQDAGGGEARFELKAKDLPASVNVTYRWQKDSPVLRKFVEVKNLGDKPHRLLNVRLGTYRTDAKTSDGEQGFPVYLNDEFFLSLAHPSGWAIGDGGVVKLRHYPGVSIAPGGTFACMESVLGVSPAGAARKQFVAYVRSRMRRVVRGHIGPYGVFSNFGSWPLHGETEIVGRFARNTEKALLHSLDLLGESQKVSGRIYDYCDIEFWFDLASEMSRFSPVDFPRGFKPIQEKLSKLHIKPGLWTASVPSPWCSLNARFDGCCNAQEPFRSAFIKAYRDHIRNEGVGMCKFDCLSAMCNNATHNHLPGVYSTEAIHNAVIELLRALDDADHRVFLMLYWGYRSPWWLLDADTLFEPGVFLEAAHPGGTPTPFARDSVTQGLDQAHYYCQDVPALGKDSLGIWLSDWWWNSSIGKQRWQQGFVMDMGRGNLLPQIWADWDWLSPPEWEEMGTFFKLVKAQPACFDNSRFILGNPWKSEPYGYCCSDGRRAFFCLNNCTCSDRVLRLQLNSAWGLPNDVTWDLYRWYPKPAHLTTGTSPVTEKVDLAMRPFEVVLLEAVAKGEKPSLDRTFADQPLPRSFSEASRRVEVKLLSSERPAANQPEMIRLKGQIPSTAAGGVLVVAVELRQGGHAWAPRNTGSNFTAEASVAGRSVAVQPVLGNLTYEVPWQAWRIPVAPARETRDFKLSIRSQLPADVNRTFSAYFLPE